MSEWIAAEIAKENEFSLKKMILAECLQHLILQSLYRQRAFDCLTFTGGTALRILFRTLRFSEDLDFSLSVKEGFLFEKLLEGIRKDLTGQKVGFEFHSKNETAIAKAELRFPRLLHQFKISPLKDQKTMIKIEVDKNPPEGGRRDIAYVANPVSYSVSVFDLPSLFATKLHAVFCRRYTKGRDYYDLVWYLGRGIKPHWDLLNRAIRQTEGDGCEITEKNFKEKLLNHLQAVDFDKVRADVERFLIRRQEAELLDRRSIESLLRNYE